MKPDVVVAIEPIADAFEELGVSWHVGGSVASSAQGLARATLDADLVADLREQHVARFVARLEAEYYIDADMIRDAIRRRATFNLLHLATMTKVDVFILQTAPYEQEAFRRRQPDTLEEAPDARIFWLSSPEDTILHKLQCYRWGGEVAERQWGDVLGVMRVQGRSLDVGYLRRWAPAIGVLDLLRRAAAEAGLELHPTDQ